jgi:hypothetical protein
MPKENVAKAYFLCGYLPKRHADPSIARTPVGPRIEINARKAYRLVPGLVTLRHLAISKTSGRIQEAATGCKTKAVKPLAVDCSIPEAVYLNRSRRSVRI